MTQSAENDAEPFDPMAKIGREDKVLLREIAEALSGALTDRPQRCGHSSDPMCCPFENFPTLAEFFTSVTPPAEPVRRGSPNQPRATVDQALVAWEKNGATSLTVALMADALYGVRDATRVTPPEKSDA